MADDRSHRQIGSIRIGLLRQYVYFGIVGTAGFIVDVGTLKCLLWLGAGFLPGRIGSYLAAVTVTWYLNRRYTFAYGSVESRPRTGLLREWMRFAVSQCFGALVNISIYSWLVLGNAHFSSWPSLAVAIGSLAGMVVNFVAASLYVFPRRAVEGGTGQTPSADA